MIVDLWARWPILISSFLANHSIMGYIFYQPNHWKTAPLLPLPKCICSSSKTLSDSVDEAWFLEKVEESYAMKMRRKMIKMKTIFSTSTVWYFEFWPLSAEHLCHLLGCSRKQLSTLGILAKSLARLRLQYCVFDDTQGELISRTNTAGMAH